MKTQTSNLWIDLVPRYECGVALVFALPLFGKMSGFLYAFSA
jgi:hypothetical protein